jgi:hypothetical protein
LGLKSAEIKSRKQSVDWIHKESNRKKRRQRNEETQKGMRKTNDKLGSIKEKREI